MVDVRLQAWRDSVFDVAFDVLRRANTPEMMIHLGGPESEEKLADRQRRYLALGEPGAGQMSVITVDGAPAGVVGYWEDEWQGEGGYEAGWSVLPEFQGRGVAGAALALVIADARQALRDLTPQHLTPQHPTPHHLTRQHLPPRHRTLRAFPSIHNAASNAVCRKAAMILAGECDFEYPKGNPIRCNHWYLEL
jgi:RimJ/RimL family protein N-acetyltransferase